jgi:hypothetical protein
LFATLGVGCPSPEGADCPVGGLDCPCTQGGGCDGPLACLEGVCRLIGGNTDSSPTTTSTAGTSVSTTADTTSGSTSLTGTGNESTETDGTKLDVGVQDVATQPCVETGCRSIDLLFALDGTGSMDGEIEALAATNAFTKIVEALEDINCGDIEYRIGVTDDNDRGWVGAAGATWFDSMVMTPEEIADAFATAANSVLGSGTAIGCEHVLNSAADLLGGDTTDFLRDDALLVLVLVTDVDDYGAYDQMGFGGPCDGFLCTQSGADPQTIYDNLVSLKGGDPLALATIVVAGDPNVKPEGENTCQQPAVCCGVGLGECGEAFPAPKLYGFADLHEGMNGYTADICAADDQVPVAVEDALQNNVDLACQTFEPEG